MKMQHLQVIEFILHIYENYAVYLVLVVKDDVVLKVSFVYNLIQ